ncbi:MAG: hypothetical protein ACFCUQ_16245 [Kiloniellales bacterium]
MAKVFCMLVLAAVVGACSNPWAKYRPSEAERLRTDWYQTIPVPLEARYCYRTLARVDCFTEPQVSQSGRQVGSFHAPLQ